MEELLAQTIHAAKAMKAVDARELSRVIVDSTVQEKAIAHPTDARRRSGAERRRRPRGTRSMDGLRTAACWRWHGASW